MSIYMRSKKIDKLCLDTQSTNKIYNIFIMLGIYKNFIVDTELYINQIDFQTYYNTVTLHDSFRKFHYYNEGVKCVRELAHKKEITTYGRRLKKLSSTYSNKPVCIPKNTVQICNILFGYIHSNEDLKKVFLNNILSECSYYSENTEKYPSDCSENIFGFVSDFICNIKDPEFLYSNKYLKNAELIDNQMKDIVKMFNIKELCGKRITERGANEAL